MDNEKLYQLFFDDLTAPLAAKITPEFKEKFLALMIKKRGSLYLKNEELALDMANHCNLCQELVFPLYLQDNVVRIKVDLGLNYFSDQMLAQCNRALNNHQFTIYKIEETDPNRVKLHTKIPHFTDENSCTMISKHPDFVFNRNTAAQCRIQDGWVRFYSDSNTAKHLCKDTGLTPSNSLCDSQYCIKLCMGVLYYIKYILNEYDFYMNKREQYLRTQIEEPTGEIENIEILLDQIRNPRMKHFYGFLQSEMGLNQTEIYSYIAQQLHKNNKISSPTFYRYDMINLADELAKNPSGVKYEYTTLERDNLYIITGIDAFIKSLDYNSIMYEKKGAHLINILSEIREKRYVLIVGDKKDLRRFLDLNSQIDFIYKYCLPNWLQFSLP